MSDTDTYTDSIGPVTPMSDLDDSLSSGKPSSISSVGSLDCNVTIQPVTDSNAAAVVDAAVVDAAVAPLHTMAVAHAPVSARGIIARTPTPRRASSRTQNVHAERAVPCREWVEMDANGDGVISMKELGDVVVVSVLQQIFGVAMANHRLPFIHVLHSVLQFFGTVDEVHGERLPDIGTPGRRELLRHVLLKAVSVCVDDWERCMSDVNALMDSIENHAHIADLVLCMMDIVERVGRTRKEEPPMTGAQKLEYVLVNATALLPYLGIDASNATLLRRNLQSQIEAFVRVKHGGLDARHAAEAVAVTGLFGCMMQILFRRRGRASRHGHTHASN